MQRKKQWYKPVVCLALLQAFGMGVYAQDPVLPVTSPVARPVIMQKSPRHFDRSVKNTNNFAARLEKAVGLTPEQREAVRGVLADQRQQHEAVQEQSNAKLRALLNPEQQTKFDTFIARQKQDRAARKRKTSK
jgi:hypothetical protein